MAKNGSDGSGFVRWVRLKFDRAASDRMQAEAQDALDRAGKNGGEAFAKAMAGGGRKAGLVLAAELQREYDQKMAQARVNLANRTIDKREFARVGKEAADAFDRAYVKGLEGLRAENKLTEASFAGLSKRIKNVAQESGSSGAGIGSLLGRFGGPLAGIFTVGAALNEANQAIDAADRLSASVRKLGGAAAVTGTDIRLLEADSKTLQDRFKLSVPFANELTGAMNKMAVKAGDANLLLPAMSAWLDLAAANGLSAADAMDALNTTIIGQDEGLNKLGLANPQNIYEDWAKAAGISADKMSDAEKAQALLNAVTEAGAKVQGAYGEYLKGNAGQADLNTQKIEGLRAKMGEALQPARDLGHAMKASLYEILVPLSEWFGTLTQSIQGWVDAINYMRGIRPSSTPKAPAAPGARAPGEVPGPDGLTASQRAAKARADRAAAADDAKKERERAAKEKEADEKRERERIAAERKKYFEDRMTKAQATARVQGNTAEPTDGHGNTAGYLGPVDPVPLPKVEHLTRVQSAYMNLWENVERYSHEAAYQMSSAFQDAFQQMMKDGQGLGDFMDALGRGIAASMLAGLSQIAQAKASEAFANAIGAGARALLYHDPGAAAAVPGFLAEAAAWSALSGLTGAARGAIAGGSGAIPQSTRVVGLSSTDTIGHAGVEVNLFIDPLNPANPIYQRNVYAAQQYAQERYNGATITVHPYPAGAR
jgi:hypothetical protein